MRPLFFGMRWRGGSNESLAPAGPPVEGELPPSNAPETPGARQLPAKFTAINDQEASSTFKPGLLTYASGLSTTPVKRHPANPRPVNTAQPLHSASPCVLLPTKPNGAVAKVG